MKDPQFYCENCGNSVSLRADSCPCCGLRFDAVKCPECGFSGKAGLFSDGCPSCGYLSSLTSISSEAIAGIEGVNPAAAMGEGRRKPSEDRRGMPPWAYTVITVTLIGILIFLLVTFLKMD